jgi:NUMOD4 motif
MPTLADNPVPSASFQEAQHLARQYDALIDLPESKKGKEQLKEVESKLASIIGQGAADYLLGDLECQLTENQFQAWASGDFSDLPDEYRTPKKETPPTASQKSRGYFKPAKRNATKGAERWRILKHYPKYEISDYGRVRSLDRARPEDVLKPRLKFWRGSATFTYRLVQEDRRVRDVFVGSLLLSVGFMKPFKKKGQLV